MTTNYSPPPRRALPPDRRRQLRDFLQEEIAPPRRRGLPRIAPVFAAAAAAVRLTVAAVALGTRAGTDTASAAEVRRKVAEGLRLERTIRGEFSVRSRDPGQRPPGARVGTDATPQVPTPTTFTIAPDGSYASLSTTPAASTRDVAYDASTGVETSVIPSFTSRPPTYLRATNLDPALLAQGAPEAQLGAWVQGALAERDPDVEEVGFDGRPAWRLTATFEPGESLYETYGARRALACVPGRRYGGRRSAIVCNSAVCSRSSAPDASTRSPPADVAEVVGMLHAAGRKRETIRKSLTVLAQVLDYAGVKHNPARDRVRVRLPREEREEPTPPTAEQIEAVLPLMPRVYALAVLVLDATGMRVGELEEKGLRCGDLDEPNTRWRIRRAVEKGRRGRWVSLAPDLFAAVVATLPAREDRSPDQAVFPGLTQERLRMAIVRACKASGTPTWSPHDLRHRRISLWHRQGETCALIGARVCQRSLSVTADTYTHVLLDDRELDHGGLVREFTGGRS